MNLKIIYFFLLLILYYIDYNLYIILFYEKYLNAIDIIFII